MAKQRGLGGLDQFRKVEELTVLPELEKLIPPLTDDEFKNLEESILENGIETPIDIWIPDVFSAGDIDDIIDKSIIVDGHNRNRIIKKHGLPTPRTKERKFNSINEVEEWMLKKQLGRRNLSDANRKLVMGMLYKSVKTSKGGNMKEKKNAAQFVAESHNVSERTVKSAGEFVDGIDKLNNNLKTQVIKGEVKVKQEDIQKLAKSDASDIDSVEKIKEEVSKIDKKKRKKTKPKHVEELKADIENEKTSTPSIEKEEIPLKEKNMEVVNIKNILEERFSILQDKNLLYQAVLDFLNLEYTIVSESDRAKLHEDGYTLLRADDQPVLRIKKFTGSSWKTLEDKFSSIEKRNKRLETLLKDKKTISG